MEEFKVPIVPEVIVERKLTEVSSNELETPTECIADETGDSKKQEEVSTTQSVASCEATCPYRVPSWSAAPAWTNEQLEYKFEVLKSGQIIEEVRNLQEKAVWKFGRLPSNDIEMAHPTISRFHAVLQYRPLINNDDGGAQSEVNSSAKFGPGWYVFDLGSTHGTFLNKQRIPAKTYIRIQVGHMLRLGASTRCFILQGPSEDEEPETELTITELRALRQQQEAEKLTKAIEAQRKAEERERELELAGVNWGMMEDADEETDLTINPYASTNNEDLFLDDPKRTLRGFFEREGLELVYKCDEMSIGSFVCRVELPVDDSNGRPIVAEVVHKGRKKECVVQCALEACRILDRFGVLRQANQEPLKRRAKKTDSDDDDEFWDRTGDVERKKMRKAQTNADVALTYDDLLKQEIELLAKIEGTQKEIEKYQELQKRQKATQLGSTTHDMDLDGFMQSLSSNGIKELDKTEIRKLRMEEQRLNAEYTKLKHLLKVAKPYELPYQAPNSSLPGESKIKKIASTKQLPMIGKRNQFSKFKVVPKPVAKKMDAMKPERLHEEEENENDDEDNRIKSLATDALKSCELDKTIRTPELKDSLELNISPENDIPEESKRKSYTENSLDDDDPVDLVVTTDIDTSVETSASTACAKKRRQRLRLRGKREDIEELVEHESTDKYAKWVPPQNQTGDGITELNQKYGY